MVHHIRRQRSALGLAVVAVFLLAACQAEKNLGENAPGNNAVGNDTNFNQSGGNNGVGNDGNGNNATGNGANGTANGDQPEFDDGWGRGVEVALASDGVAELPIVIGEDAHSSFTVAANELAEYLERITGASFEVIRGDGSFGIVLGRPGDFAALPIDDVTFGDGPFDMEDYVVRTTEDGLYLLGSTTLATRFAVWDLLYHFGHRQFFPTETWEVVPEHAELSVAADVEERPDYHNRQGPRGAMRMDQRPWAQDAWENWQIRNRTAPTFTLATGHAYDSVISANQSAFNNNPEYWGLINGSRTSNSQPNVSHPAVQQMFINYAMQQIASNPNRHSVAMDPRDGNYWCESPESRAIGGPSEQAVFLANLVAEAVVAEYGDEKFVGMYGYSHHSPPPEIDVHPNVIVSLATAYIRGGYTFEDMLDGWSERANLIGIREYYGIWNWHQSLPGHGATAANTKYIRDSIPYFHSRGARFMNAESNDTWGGYGLGYYMAARFMWNVDEASRYDEVLEDFLDKAFGPAKEPMGEFYALIDGSSKDPAVPSRPRQLNDDMVGRMYRFLEEARLLAADDDRARARIDDLILYTHYVELYRRFDTTEGPSRQGVFDDLVSFTWRMRATMMTESVEMNRGLNTEVRRDSNLEWGAGYDRHQPAYRQRVNENVPFSDLEILDILEAGIANHDLLYLDFDHWEDSGILVPAEFAAAPRGGPENRVNRGAVEASIHTDDGVLPIITISAGHIYDDLGPLQWNLHDEDGILIDHGEVVPDKTNHHFELSAPGPGVYRLSMENASQGHIWNYEPRGAKLTLLAGGEYELRRNWYDRLYFYVPAGTDSIYIAGTLMEGRHRFVDGDGVRVDSSSIEVVQDYTIVPVPQGQDGAIWSLELTALRANIRLLNVPGYMAFSPDELLLPQELVDQLP